MGLILDTCILIDAERKRLDAEQILSTIADRGWGPVALSVMTVMELAHGVARSQSELVRRGRRQFLDDIRRALPVVPFTEEIAVQAGTLDGTLRGQGFTMGTADAIIAAGVVTRNVKHFAVVPGLDVVEM